MPLRSKLFVICFCLAGFCSAQELVKDINSEPGSQVPFALGYSQRCYSCGGKTYVMLTDPLHGSELWITDGTSEGTHLVKDVEPGTENGLFGDAPVCLNNKLYFASKKLWKTDGTEAGTQVVFTSHVSGLVLFQDKIAFTSNNMLFTTDGDPANIKVVRTFTETEGSLSDGYPMRATNDRLYIISSKFDIDTGETTEIKLWVSDGTTTTKLKDLPDNSVGLVSSIGNKYLFTLYEENENSAMWVSDGTVDGTKLLLANTTFPPYESFNRIVNGKHMLHSQGSTWVTDGTTAGTVLAISGFRCHDVRGFKGKLYFLAEDPDNSYDYKIRRTNSDYTNPVDVVSSVDGVGLLGVVGDKLLYTSGTPSQGVELLSFDGIQDLPSIVKDIHPGSNSSFARSFASVNNNVGVFVADDGVHGYELWKSDGTEAGTMLLKDVATNTEGTRIEDVYFQNNKMYFLAIDGPSSGSGASRRLWVSNGTATGTLPVDAVNTNYYGTLYGVVGNYAVTSGNSGLDKTDIQTGVRSALAGTRGGGGFLPIPRLAVGDNLYVIYGFDPLPGGNPGDELWRINPNTNELVLTKDINPGPNSSIYSSNFNGATINGKVIFGASDSDNGEPWITDGTPMGTVLLKEINSPGGSYPYGFTSVGNKVFFIASADRNDQLWITDGTNAGTKQVRSPLSSTNWVTSTNMGALGSDKVLFGATTSENNTELWISDGTADGTKAVKTINESKLTRLSRFTSAGSRVYFVEDEKRLWVSDGTEAGTVKIDFDNGGSLKPDKRSVSDGVFYFYNNGKIWYTYGSTASTQVLGTATPMSDIFVTDKYVCFVQNDPIYGVELFRFPVPPLTTTGLEDPDEQIAQIYPNPTNDLLYIKVASPSHVRILDISGREYCNRGVTTSDNAIDVSTLSPGVYFATIRDDNQTYHVRFLKR